MKKNALRRIAVCLIVLLACSLPGSLARADVVELVGDGADAIVPEATTPPQSAQEPVVAPAQEAHPAPTPITAMHEEQVIVAEERPKGVYRVTFYDLDGNVYGWADVKDGDYLIEPDTPHFGGYVFHYWFDGADEEYAPYPFGEAIHEDMALWPRVSAVTTILDSITQSVSDIINELDTAQGDRIIELIEGSANYEQSQQQPGEQTQNDLLVDGFMQQAMEQAQDGIAQPEEPLEQEQPHVPDDSQGIIAIILGGAETPAQPDGMDILGELEPIAPPPSEPAPQIPQESADDLMAEILDSMTQDIVDMIDTDEAIEADETVEEEPQDVQEQPSIEDILGLETVQPDMPQPTAEVPDGVVMPQDEALQLVADILQSMDLVEQAQDEPELAEELVLLEEAIEDILDEEETEAVEETEAGEETPAEPLVEAEPDESEGDEPDAVPERELEIEPESIPATDEEELDIIGAEEHADAQDVPIIVPEEVTVSSEPEGKQPEEPERQLRDVEVWISYLSDDDQIGPGSYITLVSEISGVPHGATVRYQWQNDSTGVFADVPGATGSVYSYVVTEETSDCNWRVLVDVEVP